MAQNQLFWGEILTDINLCSVFLSSVCLVFLLFFFSLIIPLIISAVLSNFVCLVLKAMGRGRQEHTITFITAY